MTSAAGVRRALRELADPSRARFLELYFKTGPGEYGEGDRFIGLTVPRLRSLARRFHPADFGTVRALLRSPIHEERFVALLLLVERHRTGSTAERRQAHALYLRSFPRINNWDLVDLSAGEIVGAHGTPRAQLLAWAASDNLWIRRIAIVSTYPSIRRGRFGDTLAVARRLISDPEDLIHKAVGWMLREVGKRNLRALEAFLRPRLRGMPRTMLRYAIERFPQAKRKAYLRGTPP